MLKTKEITDKTKTYKELIHGHIHLDRPISSQAIREILLNFPDLKFYGKAYRVLSFSNETSPVDITKDVSFTSNFISAVRFGSNLDHDFIHLYEANIEGLDLVRSGEVFGEIGSGETITNEQEILALRVYETLCVFSGSFDEFYKKYLRGSR